LSAVCLAGLSAVSLADFPAVSLADFPAVFFIRQLFGGLEGLSVVFAAG
jgi:hypothetical protein